MSALLVNRYLREMVQGDLGAKMVFLAGPRQVGKTTFAQSLLKNYHDGHLGYMNWDENESRRRILHKGWPVSERILVFDEVHKYPRWRNLIKGYYDLYKGSHSFLITGSARLDHYRRGGDSLLGRYHHFRLHPFTLPELKYQSDGLKGLMKFGGFPEPFLRQSERVLRRWHLQRLELVLREDLTSLERVREVALVERLADALPERVGAPLSVKNVAGMLEVDFKTALRWTGILENLYYAYRIPPFGSAKIRAVKKEQKLYLWDWSQVPELGFRFENMVASHLLKFCHFREDTEGYRMELRYLRDVDKREIDFVVLQDRKPLFAVECKTGEKSLSPHINYFKARTVIPKFYQVHMGKTHRSPEPGIEIIPFAEFCRKEKLV